MIRAMFVSLALAVGVAAAAPAASRPLIRNPALLNIGFVCKWHRECIGRQERAMKRALAYVKKSRPPAWKIQLCNRNASRRGTRVDWIGYNNCIRNPSLVPPRTTRR